MRGVLIAIGLLLVATAAHAQSTLAGDAIHISRIHSPITIDGRLSEPGWQDAATVTTWYETNPGDNSVPAFKSVGHVGFDDTAFYHYSVRFIWSERRLREADCACTDGRDSVPSVR